jgi:hypothetical protein
MNIPFNEEGGGLVKGKCPLRQGEEDLLYILLKYTKTRK